MLAKDMREEAEQKIKWFKSRGGGMITHMMLNEIKDQFIDMANGGDGSCVGNGEIRNKHYAGMPDAFFQHVCNAMGWDWGVQQRLPWGS